VADKKKMSVAEILAAARAADGGGKGPDAPAPRSESAGETKAPAPKSVPKAGAGERPSVAEMLAMARGEKASPPTPSAAKAPAEKPKPTEKPSTAKAKPEPAPVASRESASILAAARKADKPGPITKAEAAAKGAPVSPKGPVKEKIVVPPMPAKPDYAKAKPAAAASSTADEETRRDFLGIGFWLLGAVSAFWTLLTVKFMFPNVLREPPSMFKVGFPDAFPPGQVSEKFKAQFAVWIVNTEFNGRGEIFALKSVCTHLGCTPNWLEAEQKFKCPCHGSGFYKDGVNFEGPAPRPLERYAIRLADDGQIEVDKSRTFQEERGQWTDPASFIPV